MRDELINYLEDLKQDRSFDFILLTGDLTHQGKEYDDDVKYFLNGIVEQINISKKDIHLIPGNHDITRDMARSLIIDGIVGSKDPSEKIDSLDDRTYEHLISAQTNFFSLYKEYLGEDYPKEELHFIKSTNNYNIFLMNTCLISHQKGEEGKLLIGRKKFYSAIRKLKQLDNNNKLNIAIGHHTLQCIDPNEKKTILANFEDSQIDIYLSGHVHDPAYNVTQNMSNLPFLELVSGAIVSDNYAVPGFVVVDVDLVNGETEATYHIWNNSEDYWSINNQVGRRTKRGKLEHKIERLKKKQQYELVEKDDKPIDDLVTLDIDENEFKQFLIDFHEQISFEGPLRSSLDNQIELDNKFFNMKCSDTFQKMFESYSKYFGNIYQIMESTAYVSYDKKDLIAEIIIEKYLEIHNKYNNGDEIFNKIVDLISNENQHLFPYSRLQTKRYIKILTAWSIYECDIFNENKRSVAN